MEKYEGLQAAGLINITHKETKGAQLSGVLNVTGSSLKDFKWRQS
jgi:hypothetical protein